MPETNGGYAALTWGQNLNYDPRKLRAEMTAIAIIPARYASSRLPGKPLSKIADKPMIQHVVQRVEGSGLFRQVIVATDDERILKAVESFGGTAKMTSPDHQTGTDRIAEVAREIDADIIVNVQGDEPLIPTEVLTAVLAPFDKSPAPQMTTVATRFGNVEEFLNPNQGKVVMDKNGRALYFTRSPIPYDRAGGGTQVGMTIPAGAYKTIGIYGYTREFLFAFAELAPTPLEQAESLEQLRALEHGYNIQVGFSEEDTFGVDTPEDLERVRSLIEMGRS